MAAYADLTNLANILKIVYGEGLTKQFNDEYITYNLFKPSDRKPAGKGYVFGIRYARAQGTGGRAESAKLPDPLTGIKSQGTILPRYIYGSIRITGPAIEAAKGNVAAFVDALADEIDDIYQSIIVDLNRQCHGDGFGHLGTLSAAATAKSADPWTATFDNDMGVTYMMEGQLVDFYASDGATVAVDGVPDAYLYGQRIASINPTTKTVTFEKSGIAYGVNHPIPAVAVLTQFSAGTFALTLAEMAIKMGARDEAWTSAKTPVELTGLLGIFDDGTKLAEFEGIAVAGNPKWKANIMSNAGVSRELSIDLMLNACDLTRTRSGQKVDTILMGLGQRRKYANLLLPDVRFAPVVLRGGYETLTFSGGDGSIELLIDPLCQPGHIFFMPKDVVQKYELSPLGWGNLDGSQLHQRAGYDEYDAFLRLYSNMGCEQRNNLSVIKDLTEPSLY